MKKSAEKYYKKLIADRIPKELNREDYFEFCLNYVKDHIVDRYNSKFTSNNVIDYWFKRGMAEKWKLEHYYEEKK